MALSDLDTPYSAGRNSPLRKGGRPLESRSGSMRRAARRLRRKGYAKASEQMALDAEVTRQQEKDMRGGHSIRDAKQHQEQRDLAEQASKAQRAFAAGVGPKTTPATGELLQQRRSLFEEMKAARKAGEDVNQFRDRATELQVTTSGFDRAVSRLPQAGSTGVSDEPSSQGGVKSNTPTNDGRPVTPVPTDPTKPAGPAMQDGRTPVQGAQGDPEGITVGGKKITNPDGTPVLPGSTGEGVGQVASALEPPEVPTTPEDDTPASAGGPSFDAETESRINGLSAPVANEIAKEYADIPSRVQKLVEESGEKYGLEWSDEEKATAAEGFRKRLHERTKTDMLRDLRKTDPEMADRMEEYGDFVSEAMDMPDPREVLTYLRDQRDSEKANRSPADKKRMAKERKDYLTQLRKDSPRVYRHVNAAYASGAIPEGTPPEVARRIVLKQIDRKPNAFWTT